jgi:hypothetical protein
VVLLVRESTDWLAQPRQPWAQIASAARCEWLLLSAASLLLD